VSTAVQPVNNIKTKVEPQSRKISGFPVRNLDLTQGDRVCFIYRANGGTAQTWCGETLHGPFRIAFGEALTCRQCWNKIQRAAARLEA
jgi:hypothetical protein